MAVNEYQVLALDEIGDQAMRAVKAGSTDVLLVRDGDNVYATGATCTHYGAPLEKGVYRDGTIHCPWHKACFRANNGGVLQPPALDSLPSFPTRIVDGHVMVSVPDDAPDRVTPVAMGTAVSPDDRTFVIVGAGAAGGYAAQRLRLEGFRGRLVLVSMEDRVPYDRTKLSKPFLAGQQSADQLPLRPAAFYTDHDIERVTATVQSVDVPTRTVRFADGREPLVADALLIASGSEPKRLDVPGVGLRNVFTLRVVSDAEQIIAAVSEGARAVVVGDGFIGLEAAASLTQRGASVTLVSPTGLPLSKVLGDRVASVLARLHRSKGVTIATGEVAAFTGDDAVSGVRLSDGQELPADLVVYGIGVSPRVDLIQGVEVTDDGGIAVGPDLRVADGVWVAGDIASVTTNGRHIEHWRVAEQHGWVAAAQMLGLSRLADNAPFFWTNQFGVRVDVTGQTSSEAEIVVDGDLEADQPTFIAWYLDGDRVVGAAAIQNDHAIIDLMDRWNKGEVVSVSDVQR